VVFLVTGANGWPWGSDPSCPEGVAPQCPINPVTDFENYFPHPTDCHFYIQCDSSGKALCRSCAPTTYFSPRILNCVWPLDAACEHNATTRAESLLPPICGPDRCQAGAKKTDYSDCTHYFICSGSFEERRPCPEGQHFNARRNECDDRCSAGCENPCVIPECKQNCKCDANTPPRVDPADCTTCEVCRGGKLVKERCPTTVATQCGTCERTEDPTDCQRYYDSCSESWEHCQGNLHFNPVTKSCGDPCTAGCKHPCEIRGCFCPCDENMPPRVDSADCTICEVCRGGKLVKERCPTTAATQCGTCERIEDPTDCQRYYDTCTESWEHCQGNLHFNPITKSCGDPCTAGCKHPCEIRGCFCPCDENMPPRADSTDCTICEVCRGGQIVKEVCPSSFIGKCTENKCCSLTRHDTDCQLYYNHCSLTWSHCPGNLHFNEATHACDHPCNAGCIDRRRIQECCETEGDILEDPCSCDTYYICTAGIKILVRCENGQQYNSSLRQCDSSCSGDCPKLFRVKPECCASTSGKPEPPCPSTTYPMFLPHPSNSRFFYECLNGVRTCRRCPSQLRWNTDMDVCDESFCPGQDNTFQLHGAQTKTSLH
jgi:hypothetical protein